MADHLTKEKRSWNMSRIRSTNTSPELSVRRYIYSHGVRYRLHKRTLPGKPDIVVSRIKTAVFVNGCFWHHHSGCSRSNWPKSNTDYWRPKINRTIERDQENYNKLIELGWKVQVIWECEAKSLKENNLIAELINNYKLKTNR